MLASGRICHNQECGKNILHSVAIELIIFPSNLVSLIIFERHIFLIFS